MASGISTPPDLGVLSRSSPAAATNRPSAIPRPTSRWKTRVLVPAAIFSAAGALLIYSGRHALIPATEVRVVPAVMKTVQAGPGETSPTAAAGTVVAQAAGWVEADPYPFNVAALTDGVVKEVLVLEGQPVEAGQVVATLVDDDARLAAARAHADLRRLVAEQAAAEARLEAAQREWDNPVTRTRAVATAEAMLAESRGELDRLPAEVAVEEGRLAELQEQLRRTEELRARQSATDYEVTELRLRIATQEASLAALRARRPILEAKVRQQEAELAAARENLRLRIEEQRELDEAKAAVAAAEAAVEEHVLMCEEADLRVQRTQVRSPVAGIVMARLIEPGAKLMAGMDDPKSAYAVRLYDPAKLQVRVDVPLADAAKVGVGQAATVVVEVLPDRTFHGIVTRIVNEADIQKNTLQVKVAIQDPAPELKPEMLARVKFLGGRPGTPVAASGDGAAAERVFAPAEALVMDAHAAHGSPVYAWVVDRTTSAAAKRTLKLAGPSVDGWYPVAEGLAPGDLLIAGDHGRLREGAAVRIAGEAPLSAGSASQGGN